VQRTETETLLITATTTWAFGFAFPKPDKKIAGQGIFLLPILGNKERCNTERAGRRKPEW
jgi:hypothetical protein